MSEDTQQDASRTTVGTQGSTEDPSVVENPTNHKKHQHHSIWFVLKIRSLDYLASFVIIFHILFGWETLICLGSGVGAMFFYKNVPDRGNSKDSDYPETFWSDIKSISWTLVSFAVIFPLVKNLTASFQRREQALHQLGELKATLLQIAIGISFWNWKDAQGRLDMMLTYSRIIYFE